MRVDISSIRQASVVKAFKRGKRKKALILTAEFPFLVIGKIKDVVGDYVCIDVETTHIDQLEGRIFNVHVDRIEVFYIEEKGYKIPKIPKGSICTKERGGAK